MCASRRARRCVHAHVRGPPQAAAGGAASAPRQDYAFKVLVVGDPRVGKTSIINRYVHGSFNMHYKLTLGVDFALKVLHRPSSVVRLQLRDIAGQEKAGTMTRVYYRDATAAVVVFDVSARSARNCRSSCVLTCSLRR